MGYLYDDYLANTDWTQFGIHELPDGQPRQLASYLWLGNLGAGFEHLKHFSLSGAMLPHSKLYTYGLAPVMMLQMYLEWYRIKHLRMLVRDQMPCSQAVYVSRCLDCYLKCLFVGFPAFLALGHFHIDRTLPHYLLAGTGLVCVTSAFCIYIALPLDSQVLVRWSGQEKVLKTWAFQVKSVEIPACKAVMVLTILCMMSAAWKTNYLGDDLRSLAFGVLETIVILGYQVVMALFAIDERMIGVLSRTTSSDLLPKPQVAGALQPKHLPYFPTFISISNLTSQLHPESVA